VVGNIPCDGYKILAKKRKLKREWWEYPWKKFGGEGNLVVVSFMFFVLRLLHLTILSETPTSPFTFSGVISLYLWAANSDIQTHQIVPTTKMIVPVEKLKDVLWLQTMDTWAMEVFDFFFPFNRVDWDWGQN